jgi:hypothetical protein
MGTGQKLLGESVGIEFESERFVDGVDKQRTSGWQRVHDGSIEADARFALIDGRTIRVTSDLPLLNTNQYVYGREFVTPIEETETDEFKAKVFGLTDELSDLGEPAESYRAGLHIHVSLAYNLRILKSILRLGRWLEDVFFYIGTNTYVFRGMKLNNSAYCRPITDVGPQVVRFYDTSRMVQCYNINDMLKAKTSREFWYMYGGLDPTGSLPRYIPMRYSWLNLYSLLVHGSLEFRVFNKTLNPFFIFAEVDFCKAFCEVAIKSSLDFFKENDMNFDNSIYKARPKNAIMDTFSTFAQLSGLSRSAYGILANIIERAPEVSLDRRLVFTHLRENTSLFQTSNKWNYTPTAITDTESILPGTVTDLRTTRGER